jgi:hypothetical protein
MGRRKPVIQSRDFGIVLEDGSEFIWDLYFGPLRLGRFHERTYLVEDIHGRQRRRPTH